MTANAQAVFDALVKTLPCEWDKEDIVVLKSVRLAPPYDVKSIRYDDVCMRRDSVAVRVLVTSYGAELTLTVALCRPICSGEGEAGVIQRVKIILEHEAKAIKSASDANGVTK